MEQQKTMQPPEIEFIRINETDIITTSGAMENVGKDSTSGYGVISGFFDLFL